MNLACVNEIFSKLGQIRAELTKPSLVDSLVNQLKNQYSTLDLNAVNNFLTVGTGPGIYFLAAKFNFNTLKELNKFGKSWGKIRGKNLPVGVPRYYPKRAKKHAPLIELGDFIPFYLGKGENIRERFINHLNGSEESDTFSLKLLSRLDILKNVSFKFSYIEFNIDAASYYGVEILEAELRVMLNPIIGKQ